MTAIRTVIFDSVRHSALRASLDERGSIMLARAAAPFEAVRLSLAASTFLIARAQSGRREPGPWGTADLVQTLDQLLKKNQELVKRNQHLMGTTASLRNTPMAHIIVDQVKTIDCLAATNQKLLERNKQLLAETAAVRNNLVEGSDTHAEGKAGTIRKIIAWFFSTVSGGLG